MFCKLKGWQPVNPLKVCESIKKAFSYSELMSLDYELIKMCDAIFMVSGWQKSKGAVSELAFARSLGKKVLYEDYFNRRKK